MLEVENLSPFTRGFHVDGKEYIFRANQIRSDIPNSFLNPNGSIKFAGLLKLKRIIHENGQSTRAYIRRDENYESGHQMWEYIFEKDGQTFVVKRVTEFCEQHDLNPTSIRNYIKLNKPYKGWNISRRELSDNKINTDMESKSDND